MHGTSETLDFLFHKPLTVSNGQELIEQLDMEAVKGPFATDVKRLEPLRSANMPGVFVKGNAGMPTKSASAAHFHGGIEAVSDALRKIELDIDVKGCVEVLEA
ncbi:MAG: hypothetical protein M1821_002128 [Bathelium mastoideum]|nr:MAG: hypothetical protein M1821_002128 [Bathelium mastoideum]